MACLRKCWFCDNEFVVESNYPYHKLDEFLCLDEFEELSIQNGIQYKAKEFLKLKHHYEYCCDECFKNLPKHYQRRKPNEIW